MFLIFPSRHHIRYFTKLSEIGILRSRRLSSKGTYIYKKFPFVGQDSLELHVTLDQTDLSLYGYVVPSLQNLINNYVGLARKFRKSSDRLRVTSNDSKSKPLNKFVLHLSAVVKDLTIRIARNLYSETDSCGILGTGDFDMDLRVRADGLDCCVSSNIVKITRGKNIISIQGITFLLIRFKLYGPAAIL